MKQNWKSVMLNCHWMKKNNIFQEKLDYFISQECDPVNAGKLQGDTLLYSNAQKSFNKNLVSFNPIKIGWDET